MIELRPLGNTGIRVTPIALGCWPITGITSVGVTEADSLATIATCLEVGINFLDTAYCYGRDGESERMIRRAIGSRRDEMVIATKGGIHWGPDGKQARDGRPATLRRQCEESLRRLGTDRVELLYLHAPDPNVPVAESAGALKDLMDEGKARSIGLSNASLAQLEEFAAVCPLAAFQPHYNMLQREIEADTLPWCREHGVSVMVYWPLDEGPAGGQARARSRLRRRRWPSQVSHVSGRRVAKDPGLARRAARDRRGSWQDGFAVGDQLDDPPAWHHHRVMRGEASRPAPRERRRPWMAAQ